MKYSLMEDTQHPCIMNKKRLEALECLSEAKQCLREYQNDLRIKNFNPSVNSTELSEEVEASIRKIEEAESKICSLSFHLEEIFKNLLSDPDFMIDMIKIGGKITEKLL